MKGSLASFPGSSPGAGEEPGNEAKAPPDPLHSVQEVSTIKPKHQEMGIVHT